MSFEPRPYDSTLHGARHGFRVDACVVDSDACDHAKQRPSRVPYPHKPGSKGLHRAGAWVHAGGDGGAPALAEWVFLAAPDAHLEALLCKARIFDVETGKLAAAKGSGKPNQ
jgi:hypothetical protein